MDPAITCDSRLSKARSISEAASELGYTLKRQQQVVVSSFVSGNDVFVASPTDSSPARLADADADWRKLGL